MALCEAAFAEISHRPLPHASVLDDMDRAGARLRTYLLHRPSYPLRPRFAGHSVQAHKNQRWRGGATIGDEPSKVCIFRQYGKVAGRCRRNMLSVGCTPTDLSHPVNVMAVSTKRLHDAAWNILVGQDAHTLKPLGAWQGEPWHRPHR